MTQPCTAPIRTDSDGRVATVTIGTGHRRNALGSAGWRLLAECLTELSQRPELRAVLLRGAGDTFCAGSDMTEWIDAAPDAVEDSFAGMERAFRAVERCPVPVIAEIRGVAAGAGCQLALACDMRVLADSARIGMPIARLGILASPAFAARLARLAGPSLAGELLYTGRLLDAAQAAGVGLVNAAVRDAELAEHIAAVLDDICRHPPVAVRAAKRALAEATAHPPTHTVGPAVSHPDLQRGIAGFLESRPATAATLAHG